MGRHLRSSARSHLSRRVALGCAGVLAAGVSVTAPAATAATGTGSAPPAQSAALQQDFANLRMCESGGNYQDNTGNHYYGAYQFSVATWESLGYSGLPSDAPAASQDAAAAALQSERGWYPWPACARQLGLIPAASPAAPPPDPGLAFLTALARDTTGTPLASATAAALAARLDAGTLTRAAETAAMVAAPAYAGRQVAAAYQRVLGRGVDPTGLATWSQALESGASPAQLLADLTSSAEFYQNAGGTPAGFVAAVYQHLLGRPADAGGLAAWTGAFVRGMPRGTLALALLASREGRTDQVQGAYQSVLRRAADPGGLVTWTGVLARNGDSTTGLTAGLLASGEYFADAQRG